MNRGTFIRACVFSVLVLGPAVWAVEPPSAAAAPAATNLVGPKIQFETMVHDFGRAKAGDQVKYTYGFTNAGDQLLELTGVQACGCITADWTRKVEPGKTGMVPVAFNSSSYSGPVVKTITITCNDRTTPRPVLQLKGTVWRAIEISPQVAVLNLTPDAPLASATVIIRNNLPEPITLSAPEYSNRAFAAVVKTNQPGKEFQVIIAPVAPLLGGNTQGQIVFKTSSTNMPVVAITAFANVRPAISINPAQLVLPAAPLARAQTNTISLINNSTNPVTLSEPTINATGAAVQLKAVVPDRQFEAVLVFPQGFEAVAGQKTEVSIKSSLPLMPVLKVPILQVPRPAHPQVVPVNMSSTAITNRLRRRPHMTPPPLPPIPGQGL